MKPCEPWLGAQRPEGLRVTRDPLPGDAGGYNLVCWCPACESEGPIHLEGLTAPNVLAGHFEAPLCPNCNAPLDVVAENTLRVFKILRGPVAGEDLLHALATVQRLACHIAVKFDRPAPNHPLT